MSDVTLRWDGLDEIAERYSRGNTVVAEEMEEAAYRTMGVAARALQTYPAPRPTSSYIRTGDLARGWNRDPHFRVGRGGVQVSLANPVAYAGMVQGERQAWMHVGVWLSVAKVREQVASVYGPLYVNDALGAIARYLERGQR